MAAAAGQSGAMEGLLSSFPAPPSFIPPSPLPYDNERSSTGSDYFSHYNPPPTRPPTLPLPPLPVQPSPVHEVDALMFICNTPSRRTSQISVRSNSHRLSRMSDTAVSLGPVAEHDHLAPLQPRSSISLPDTHDQLPTARTGLGFQRRQHMAPAPAARAASPDIQDILAATPRPLVRRMQVRTSVGASSSPSLVHTATSSDENSDLDDAEQSDSSIDIRTPLPALMVKAGVLSPFSKILVTPADDSPRGSSAGASSSKLPIPKDGRDTERRRSRHRNGHLLRQGVGLTTGLGWSDSEDEDAPSALTNRLSTLDLSRRPSMLSVRGEYNRSRTPSRSPRASTFSTSTSTLGDPLSRTSSMASSIAKPPRRRVASEGSSLRTSSSTSALNHHYQHDIPAVPDLPSSPHLSPAPSLTMRRTVSQYPLNGRSSGSSQPPMRSPSLDGNSNPPLMLEKPLPHPPVLENPPPRSDSRVRGPPPSAFGGLPRPRTYSTSSSVSSASASTTTSTGPRRTSAPGAGTRPPIARQASMPLQPPFAGSSRISSASSTSSSSTTTTGGTGSAKKLISQSTPHSPIHPIQLPTPVSPSAPRTLRLGTPAATGLPVPRGRTTSVGAAARPVPRTGAGMQYRTSPGSGGALSGIRPVGTIARISAPGKV
ncbi:hypothetical protein EXIGLDRAFT_761792 [Exidia glandulosa HHB12029]|uniref:Uncharacterized protein n=1 Tax=Exidia glandulosa HHB12029 TaxID=1314781 RepID=A0A165NA74_EXIGL|nr:hypothetical protein EXIGLDRAFT_761792 [Exidia glandulosa HHB12029]